MSNCTAGAPATAGRASALPLKKGFDSAGASHLTGRAPKPTEAGFLIRLHVFLARAGRGSRRAMEAAIAGGRVAVNGKTVTEMGAKIDPYRDRVTLDGGPVQAAGGDHFYVLLNKPRGVVTSVRDERGRKTVIDLLPPRIRRQRVYPVGRLDRDSEGLVLLTNDGGMAQLLSHPSFGHEKEYAVTVSGRPGPETLKALSEGILLEDGKTAPAEFKVVESNPDNTTLKVVLREGRKRQIRRMFEARGHRVERLIRVRLGPLTLGRLRSGESKILDQEEVAAFRAAVEAPGGVPAGG